MLRQIEFHSGRNALLHSETATVTREYIHSWKQHVRERRNGDKAFSISCGIFKVNAYIYRYTKYVQRARLCARNNYTSPPLKNERTVVRGNISRKYDGKRNTTEISRNGLTESNPRGREREESCSTYRNNNNTRKKR